MQLTSLIALAALNLAAASPLRAFEARSTCPATQTGTAPPTTLPDTPGAFQANPVYKSLAVTAALTPPAGYHTTFTNQNGATQGDGYLGYLYITSYNAQQCASVCNTITGCKAVNIYVERDPGADPSDSCTNPPSVANFKCSFWNATISAATATNVGQYRQEFQVVVSASNGYVMN